VSETEPELLDEDSPGYEESGLDDDYDPDEEIEADDSDNPYTGSETHGTEEGDEDE